ncbi:F-box protein SKIP23 [Rhynchospora pubera]|uniref:F-box protein SKIP23 n=1 Tax=Rhynchospora pubera TaxID=906938 RepID=A0AAV8F0G5_9POAL|nr:F-box protein SKIP23 [Rhynchospora pubera]
MKFGDQFRREDFFDSSKLVESDNVKNHMANWSNLSCDAIEHIMGFLSLPDRHRFSAVCQNWRRVAKYNSCSPVEQLPWLMMREDASIKKRKFYSLTEKRHYYIDIPELQNTRWIGSSFGWLFIVDRKFIPQLFNPFTRECFELPMFPRFEEEMRHEGLVKAILSHDPSKTHDFTVLLLYYINNITRMAFWRPGENTWRCVPCNDYVSDAIFFRGNFYLACTEHLFVLSNVEANLIMKQVMPIFIACVKYLVDFMGELLLVGRHLKIVGDPFAMNIRDDKRLHIVTARFVVHKLNLEGRKHSECKDLDDGTIFLGIGCPLVVNSQLFPGCKRNSIYFTDLVLKLFPEPYGCDDLGVYDFTRDIIEPYYPPGIFHPIAEPPIWLTPNASKSAYGHSSNKNINKR